MWIRLTSLFLLSGLCLITKTQAQLPELIPFNTDGKWGYSDTTGKLIVAPRYHSADPLRNGWGRISLVQADCGERFGGRPCNKFGMIDSTGKVLFEPIFYHKPTLPKRLNLISREANEHGIMFILDDRGRLKFAGNDIKVLIDKDTTMLIENRDDGSHWLISAENVPPREVHKNARLRVIRKPKYRPIRIGTSRTAPNVGLIDANDSLLLEHVYFNIKHLTQELFAVRKPAYRSNRLEPRQYGVINLSGDTLIPFKYDEIELIEDSILVASVLSEHRSVKLSWIYDLSGRKLNPAPFKNLRSVGFGRFATRSANQLWRIDSSGERTLIEPAEDTKFARALASGTLEFNGDPKNIMMIPGRHKHTFMSMTGHIYDSWRFRVHPKQHHIHPRLFEPSYRAWPSQSVKQKLQNQVDEIEGFENGWSVFKRKDNYGLIDTNGRELLYKKYHALGGLAQGRAITYRRGFINGSLNPNPMSVIDTSGAVVSENTYAKIGSYLHNRAWMERGNLYGFLDLDGREVIKPIYESVSNYFRMYDPFMKVHRVLASAGTETGIGIIDMHGHPVIPHRYSRIGHFVNGIALAKRDGKFTYLQIDGTELLEPRFFHANDMRHGLGAGRLTIDSVMCIDSLGHIFLQMPGKYLQVVGNNLLMLERKHIISADGKQTYFEADSSLIWLGHGVFANLKDARRQLINKYGKPLSDKLYDEVKPFEDGMAAVKRDSWTCIDTNGREIYAPQFEKIANINHGVAFGMSHSSEVLLNSQAQVLFSSTESKLGQKFNRFGQLEFYESQRQGMLDTNGQLILMPTLTPEVSVYHALGERQHAPTLHYNARGYAQSQVQGKTVILDSNGTITFRSNDTLTAILYIDEYIRVFTDERHSRFRLFNPVDMRLESPVYSMIETKHANRNAVFSERDSSWGYVDENGKLCIAARYDYAGPFVEGHALVWQNHKCGIIDSTGAVVLPIIYRSKYYAEGVKQKVYRLQKDGKTTLFSARGQKIADIDTISRMEKLGPDHLTLLINGSWIIMTLNGRKLPGRYMETHTVDASPGLFFVRREDNRAGYIDKYGRQYWSE